MAGQSLTYEESYSAMISLLDGELSPIIASAFLVAIRAKGETVQEMTAMANAMVDEAVMLDYPHDLIDTCGTGGDQKHTVNISTMAAIVVAASGIKVAKHGNRAASSLSGSADVLEALGVRIDLGPTQVRRCLDETNIGFCLAPRYHPAMANVVPVRRGLGVPTSFNFLGPLVNPAKAKRQVVGVFNGSMLKTMAEVLSKLGSEHALVAHSYDGYDELSTTSPNYVVELTRDGDSSAIFDEYVLDAMDFGLRRCDPKELLGGDASYNASILLECLDGKQGAVRDIVVLNSGAGIYVGGGARSIADGIEMAREVIDSGRAKRTLEGFIATSNMS